MKLWLVISWVLLTGCGPRSPERAPEGSPSQRSLVELGEAGARARELEDVADRIDALLEELRGEARPREEILADLRKALAEARTLGAAVDEHVNAAEATLHLPPPDGVE